MTLCLTPHNLLLLITYEVCLMTYNLSITFAKTLGMKNSYNILTGSKIQNGLKLLVLVLLLSCYSQLKAQLDFSPLDKKLNTYKLELGINYACLIEKDGKVLFKKESPDFDVKTSGTLGSTSQWLTAALVMSFVDQGKLSLDDNITQYLPIFAEYGKKYITLRHCLAGQTGIEAPKGIAKLFEKNRFESLEEEVNSYANKHEILYNPGTAFMYNSIGLNLAARIVEVVSKKSFEQMMMERIVRPLAMKSTSFSDNDRVTPASSGTASALDMTNFMTMILNKGIFNGKRILSEKAVVDMETLQIDASLMKDLPPSLTGFTYGVGEWVLDKDANGQSTVIGFPNMYGSLFFVDKCKGYTFALLTKSLQMESKKETYLAIKKIVDGIIQDNGCATK